ncbi:MAG TPA: hypothetical protein VFC56_12720 [Stellaceae bacterium]|nr:hypothetical protein [Stellaceae bacterium]
MGKTRLVPGWSWLVAAVAAFALVGAHSLHPRELYNQMYPVEALKRDTFRICNNANPAFIRAIGADREACYASMPHIIAVALGRVRRPDLSELAMLDPPHQVELLMTLAAMPPRQPITAPRSFDNISWMRQLSLPCADKKAVPPISYVGPSEPHLQRGGKAALDNAILGNLPLLTRGAKGASAQQLDVPVIPLMGRNAAPLPPANGKDKTAGAFVPLPTPDVGDPESPAIVPLAPASACGA